MTDAFRAIASGDDWTVARQYACINGLSAWFTIAWCSATSPEEDGYTDGAFPSAEARAKAIAEALNGCPVQSSWQPIETAPKDGREVILRVKSRAGIPGGTVVGHFMQGGHCVEDHPPISRGWYFWGGASFDMPSEPTHWMPLPSPPSE